MSRSWAVSSSTITRYAKSRPAELAEEPSTLKMVPYSTTHATSKVPKSASTPAISAVPGHSP
jgi:hypothetical protein